MKNGEVIIRFQDAITYGPRVWVRSDNLNLVKHIGALSIWGSYDKVEVVDNIRYVGFEFKRNSDIINALSLIFED